jgi:arylformamidase
MTQAAPAPAGPPVVHLGPPPHEKGPLVWMDMDQVELDAAYDQSYYAPLAASIFKRCAINSEAVRARLGQPLRFAYGDSAAEAMDVYPAKAANAPVFVFIHGGAWLGGEAKNYGYIAENFVNAGITFVALDFTAIGAVQGDLRAMAQQVRSGVAWAWRNAERYGADPVRFYVGGHSSGGHLCGVVLVTDWERDFGLPADFIKGGICVSGMFDLKPVRLSKRSTYVKFDDAMEDSMSALRHIGQLRAPIVIGYGTDETPEFQRQSRDFAAAVKAAGKPVELFVADHYDHFEMCEALANPYGPSGRAALRMILGA